MTRTIAEPGTLIPTTDICRYFQLARRDLVYLKFVQEAHEGLSFMSTVDRRECIVRICYPPTAANDMEGLLQALAEEITLTEVGAPPTEK